MTVRVALLLVVVACSAHDGAPAPAKHARLASEPAPVVAPGLRLPGDAAPIAYDVTLELDPEQPEFRGHVTMRVHLGAPTDHVWLSIDELDVAHASYRDGNATGELGMLPVTGDQMRAFGFGHVIDSHEVTLELDYTGHMLHDEEGIFRQREGGRWYLFSQSESVYARRIVPCFDEPRFKVPWKVTLVVPADQVALANMPQVASHARPDGRVEVAFAETPPMSPHLLAVAVGPFELVDVGKLGKQRVPVRVAALQGQRDRVRVVAARLPDVIATAEDFLGDTLPLAKLDLVVVPHLFGAMENPGLVTFEEPAIVGDAQRPAFWRRFVKMAAHEIVHQWYGNLVTPAWWDDLWLAEAFASWWGDRIAAKLDAFEDPDLTFAFARRDALVADAEPDARAMRRKIEHNEDPDSSYDTIAYEKGEVMLETWSHGVPHFEDSLQTFLQHHRNSVATTRDLFAALAATPEAERMMTDYLDRAGAPVVDLALHCTAGKSTLDAHVRDGRVVPVCLRYGNATTHMVYACKLVGDRATFDVTLADGCATYVFGNRNAGYYTTAWKTDGPLGPLPPLDELSAREQIAIGDDVVAALDRGELSAHDAIAALRTLAKANEPYVQLAAVAIARAIDPLVPPASRAPWSKLLAAAFASRLTAEALVHPRSAADHELRDELAVLVPASALPTDAVKRAARELDQMLGVPGGGPDPALAAVAASAGGRALFDHLAAIARDNQDPDVREAAIEAIGDLGADQVPRALDFFLHSDQLPADVAWTAIGGYFARSETREAAWQAVRAHLPELLARMPADETSTAIDSFHEMCDSATRAEVATALEAHVTQIANGRREIDRALAAIDRCIARKGHAGDIAAALRN